MVNPGPRIDRPQRRCVLGEHAHHAAAPDIGAGTQMGKHVVRGPLVGRGSGAQSSGRQTGGQRGDPLGRFCKHAKKLLNGECFVGHRTDGGRRGTRTLDLLDVNQAL